MSLFWFVVGVLVGMLLAWWFLTDRFRKQLREKEEELVSARQQFAEEHERPRGANEANRPAPSLPDERDIRSAPAENGQPPPDNQRSVPAVAARPAAVRESQVTSSAKVVALGGRSAGPPPAPTIAGSDDDLTRIKGIGRVLQGRLHDLGVTTFQQIADFTPADIERIDKVLRFSGRIEREKWVEQARKIVSDSSSN